MPRLPDEQWEMIKDSIDKKRIANSSHNRRSHCGKGGSIKLPSDYMTKKELKAMNGEIKTYCMNDPMTWAEFKKLPNDLKVVYVKSLREKYKVPDNVIAKAMGISSASFSKLMHKLGLGLGKEAGGAGRKWNRSEDANKFWDWYGKEENTKEVKDPEDCEKSAFDISDESLKETVSSISNAIPKSGELSFDCCVENVIDTIRMILGNSNVHLHVKWTIKED